MAESGQFKGKTSNNEIKARTRKMDDLNYVIIVMRRAVHLLANL